MKAEPMDDEMRTETPPNKQTGNRSKIALFRKNAQFRSEPELYKNDRK